MQTQKENTQTTPAQHMQNQDCKYSEKVQEVIDKLKSGEMKFIC